MKKLIALILAVLMTAGMLGPGTASADGSVNVTQSSEAPEGVLTLTKPVITGLSAPVPGEPYPVQASVETAEGIGWNIPVFWTNEEGSPTEGTAGEGLAFPVLVFFVPAEYTICGEDGTPGVFSVSFDEAVLALFRERIPFSVYDAESNITYILTGGAESTIVIPTVKFEPPQIPDSPEAGAGTDRSAASEGTSAPTETVVADRAADSEEGTPEPAEPDASLDASAAPTEAVPSEEAARLPVDLVPVHCSKTAMENIAEEELARMVDLIKYKIQPQAVNLLLDRFPAFREAYDKGGIGKELGLYIYCGSADPGDRTPGHFGFSTANAYASLRHSYPSSEEDAAFVYLIAVNLGARGLFSVDENNVFVMDDESGKHVLTTDENRLNDLANTLTHEMLHTFMSDYNRVGMTGYYDPDMWRNPEFSTNEKYSAYYDTLLPIWFKEGLACSVQNVYQVRNFCFNILRYGKDGMEEDYTQENVLNAYQTSSFRMPNGAVYTQYYDIEKSGDKNLKHNTESQYTMGYLACLYLAEMAVGKNGESAVSMDEAGDIKLNSDPIRRGINTILERMHQGETLDELICDISGGRFADTADFERKFIKKDTDSLDFCVAYLNYMQELSMDPDREYLPSGSVLLDFDLDYNSPIDININGERNAYVLIDTDQQVPSTVDILQAYMDGGRSLMGIGDLREPDEEEPEDEENDEETEMSDQDENPGDLEGDELEEGEEEEETAGPEPLGEQPDDSEASLYVGDESGDSAGSEYPDSWDGDSEWDSE